MTESRAARGLLGSLIVLLLCGVAVMPLLRGASPCTHDGGLHYFRVAALKHSLKQGILFSRWLPDLAFGYGFPFFNYRSPVSYYVSSGLYLIGLPLPWALNLVYVLSILGSAAGMYLFARDIFGVEAGLVAAVAYAHAPYQFLNALLRGNMPESLALALMPFVLWAFRRLALEGGRRWFLVAAGMLAALYLSHNISSLLFTPLLLIYVVLLWWVYRQRGHWTGVALAFGLALGMTAFFWFPALAEKKFVQLNMTRTTRNNDFHHNFVGLAEIFAPPAPVDTSLMNPPMRIHLGMVQTLLAGGGLIMGLTSMLRRFGTASQAASGASSVTLSRRKLERSATLIFATAFAVLLLFMSTRASQWLWEHIPLLPFVQFPWRFVGRAALPVALLVGGAVHFASVGVRTIGVERLEPHVLRLIPFVCVTFLILSAFPSTYPPRGYCPQPSSAAINDVFAYERQSGLVGVDPVGAYFPTWVEQRPEGSPLEDQYSRGSSSTDGAAPERFDASALPDGAEIVDADYGPNRARVVVESPEAFQARYLTFYFPGWRAHVDGKQVPISPSHPEGLITLDVPAGRHTIRVRFGETPLRLAADLFSMGYLLLALLYTLRWSGSEEDRDRPC